MIFYLRIEQEPFDTSFALGQFTDAPPRSVGRCRYDPFRGGGHLMLGHELASKGKAECWYEDGAARVCFQVISCPEYGVLDLDNFRDEPIS